MKCPYCAEEIQDNAMKCKHCKEWLPSTSYFYPADKSKSNFNNLFVLEIEGEKIKIERSTDENICIFRGDEKVQEIPKNKSGKVSEIELAGHKLIIQYKEPFPMLDLLLWNSGFRINVDGKPVEKTLDDPQQKIEIASFAFYLFAIMSLISIFINPDFYARLGAIILLLIFVAFGLLTKRNPVFITLLGSSFGIYQLFIYLVKTFDNNYITKHNGSLFNGPFLFFFLLRGGATLALIQGVIAGIKLESLKRKFIIK